MNDDLDIFGFTLLSIFALGIMMGTIFSVSLKLDVLYNYKIYILIGNIAFAIIFALTSAMANNYMHKDPKTGLIIYLLGLIISFSYIHFLL